MSQDKALIPTEQRSIDFYGDELIVVTLEGQPYIPILSSQRPGPNKGYGSRHCEHG